MKCKIIDFNHVDLGFFDLNPSIFGLPLRSDILHSVVRWQLAKRRSGNHKTKGISEISGSTIKPYKQKRTGRARQGSLRSPQFRGGAVIFGPVVRSHAHSLNKKVRKLGLKVALSLKLAQNQLFVIENFDSLSGKTSEMVKFLSGFSVGKSLLIVSNESDLLMKASANIHSINLIKPIGVNVYDLLRHDNILVTRDSLVYLEGKLL